MAVVVIGGDVAVVVVAVVVDCGPMADVNGCAEMTGILNEFRLTTTKTTTVASQNYGYGQTNYYLFYLFNQEKKWPQT